MASSPTGTASSPIELNSRDAILSELSALLSASKGIDEARAKKVRKAIDSLSVDAAEESSKEEQSQDQQIQKKLGSLRKRINQQVERREKDYERAVGLLDELETAVHDKELKKAADTEKLLLSILSNIPGLSEQRWKSAEKRLNRTRPQLRKLQSWRHWGTTQAREDLIDQVKLLQGSRLHPEKLAKTIQEARDQWRGWDKSGDHPTKDLWEAFDKACEVAYEPCIAHFNQLKANRKQNLEKRRAIITKLNERFAATEWNQPNWRSIDQFVRTSRRDFYKIGNVDYKHRTPTEKSLNAAIDPFELHLARERSRCLKQRENLIVEVTALTEVEDLRAAMNQLQTLKDQWVVTVIDKRGIENRLWKKYQAACDLIYQRRDAERKAQNVERDTNYQQKLGIVKTLEELATTKPEELLANSSRSAQLRDQWQEIGWVPRKVENQLNSRWREAQKQFQAALKKAQSQAANTELANLLAGAELCNAIEQASLAGKPKDADKAKKKWEKLGSLSTQDQAPMDTRFTQALDAAANYSASQLDTHLTTKQEACLKLEVMLEVDSPAEFQKQRMAYQIERLAASMKKDASTQDSADTLLKLLCYTAAVPAQSADALQQRVQRCFERHTA